MSALARLHPLRTALGTLRSRSRERLPFQLRVSLRRVPAAMRWLLVQGLPRSEPLAALVVERRSPLRRAKLPYSPELQQGKEQNVARAASALDGLLLPPGARLSWGDEVGPPLQQRGFVLGPELHDSVLTAGVGGGACQVANLLLYLAVHAGLEVLERHRHAFDLFPDDHRDVPFGLGATVFWPTLDLVLRNPHPYPLRLGMAVHDGYLHGALTAPSLPEGRWELLERDHRYETEGDSVFRCNTLVRVHVDASGRRTEELFASHRARVLYPLPQESGS
jgi:vancomycin resistance protein VanW